MHAWAHGLHQLTIVKMDVETTVYTSAVRVSRPAFDHAEERPLWDGFRKSRVYVEVDSRAERLNLRRPRLIMLHCGIC